MNMLLDESKQTSSWSPPFLLLRTKTPGVVTRGFVCVLATRGLLPREW